jgi:hypothetical protein
MTWQEIKDELLKDQETLEAYEKLGEQQINEEQDKK